MGLLKLKKISNVIRASTGFGFGSEDYEELDDLLKFYIHSGPNFNYIAAKLKNYIKHIGGGFWSKFHKIKKF